MAVQQSIPKRRTNLPPLTGIQQQVFSFLMTCIAFHNYGDCCTLEALAEKFKRSPNRFLPTLRKLAAKGYVTIEGANFPVVYPTAAGPRIQDPRLSQNEVQKILRNVRR